MITRILFIVLITIIPLSIKAQVLKGRITNQSGEPVQYATVYFQELKQGTTANARGDYEVKLSQGKYQVTYQSLGYGPVIQNITISDQTIIKDIILPVQYYMIPEVRISATGEDPAYRIMRKAIGMAPYYLNNISHYKAEVYLKGNLAVNKIPRILQKAIKMEAKKEEKEGGTPVNIKEGDVYLMESFNEIEFTAPDKYNQRVISVNSTFPGTEGDVSPMDFISASFYQPLIAEIAISPLSPQAFSYYKFQYLGATPQGNHTINKISVIPKMKSQQLFEGTIYIIEDLWCIQSLDLTNDNIMGKVNVQQLYIPVREDIWMPVSHKFIINVSIVGVKAVASYGGSVKYLDVKPNESLKKPESVSTGFYTTQTVKPVEKPPSKSQQKIEEILTKEEINNRDMMKLSKLMEQETKRSQPDSVRKSLEVTETVKHTVEKDAGKKDSAFWAEIRPVPLSDLEIKSIRIRDSLKIETSLRKNSIQSDTISNAQKKQKSKFGRAVNNIGFGHTWTLDTGLFFRFGGLIDLNNLSFNTVDGFKYGFNFRFSKSWKGYQVSISPDLRWAFSREKLVWQVSGGFSMPKPKQRSISYSVGIVSRDFSLQGSIDPFLNSITSLFLERNYMKLYESRFFNLSYRTEISNGLTINIGGGYDDRRVLDNTTSYTFIKSHREYTPNMPENSYLDTTSNPANMITGMRHYNLTATINYTPRQKYSYRGNTKINRGSDWPTFSFTWKHGANEFTEPEINWKHYDLLRFETSKNHNLGAFTEFRWRFRAGGFIDNRSVPYYDFFHFNAQPLPVLINDYNDSFSLPAYYSLSTPEAFGEVHLKYTTPYLLLKYLPGLSNTLMRENLSLSWLGSRFHPNYTELGYSITEVFLLGEAGVYAGFEDLTFRSAGIKLVLRFN